MLTDASPVVHTLHPGDVACGERGDSFATLLGSCIAVVLTDPRRTVGAMCHFVHSSFARTEGRDSAWADVAFDTMFGLLRQRGIDPHLCEAYVVGGGNMFPGLVGDGHVGARNARWAMEALERAGIPVVRHDLGGNCYRRVNWVVGPQRPQVTSLPV